MKFFMILCLSIGIIATGVAGISITKEMKKDEQATVAAEAFTETELQTIEVISEVSAAAEPLKQMENNYSGIENCVGKITFTNDTGLSYPVMWKENDSSFYLSHNHLGEKAYVGSIFMSGANKSTVDNVVWIYGHNMKNGSMFHELSNYKNPGYAEKHPVFLDTTTNGTLELRPVAVVVLRNEDLKQLMKPALTSGEIDLLTENAAYTYVAGQINKTKRLYCLTTCSYEYGGTGDACQLKELVVFQTK